MNESRIYEIALDEYDSHVGYTDDYQGTDVLDAKGTPVADDKDASDWGSKGLRDRGNKKPWSSKRTTQPKTNLLPQQKDAQLKKKKWLAVMLT